jgi:H+-translocating NAD(P) transhydrogenase subunit alpha
MTDSTRVTLGLLQERSNGERRIALTPNDVKRLSGKAGILVEEDAGREAGFSDEAYIEAGARTVDLAGILESADIIAKVRGPAEAEDLRPGTLLISLGGHDSDLAERLRKRSITHLGLERVPRTTRAQSMDVLSSQAAVAGYAAVLEGSRWLTTMLPMLTTAAGIIRPAKMIALGAGVAGLQAIATARRLGAMTHGFDIREAAREQVESLGAKFVFPDVELASVEAAGGYAAAQSTDEQHRLRRALTQHLIPMQLIVTTAQVPGKRAPLLLDDETVASLRPGTVIVDLAAESGGNCTFTKPDETVTVGGIHILGPTNMASAVATDASSLFGGNVRALLDHLIDKEGRLNLDPDDPITGPLLAGQVPSFQSVAA